MVHNLLEFSVLKHCLGHLAVVGELVSINGLGYEPHQTQPPSNGFKAVHCGWNAYLYAVVVLEVDSPATLTLNFVLALHSAKAT